MKNRLIIIGLDGGTFKIIDPLIEAGKLPNLKRLLKEGTRAVLKSTLPPLTPPAWVSFMTGMNPGKHGFVDFRKLEKITYNSPYVLNTKDAHTLLHSGYYAGNTLWDILSRAGCKVSVIMMPMTYPAWEINGYMIAGYPSPDFKKPSTYPPEWGAKVGPLFDISAIGGNNESRLVEECKHLVRKEGELFLKQLKEADCAVHAVVFSSTDFAQHHLWKYLSDNSSRYSSAISEIYIEIDQVIGRVFELIDEKTSIIILSDHGFTAFPKEHFHTNAWLKEEGYLSVKDKGVTNRLANTLWDQIRYQKMALKQLLKGYLRYFPESIQIKISNAYYNTSDFEWLRTKAFRYPIGQMEGIAINLKNRCPEGIVEENEYEILRDEIIDKLKEVVCPETGRKVVKEIYKREQVYSGKFLELLPDIVFTLEPTFQGGLNTDGLLFSPIPQKFFDAFSGIHDRDGILILSGTNFKKDSIVEPVELVDLLPTILFDLGFPIPKYVDGRVIREAFREPFSSLPINYTGAELIEKEVKSDLSEEDEEVMKKALKGLGYLE